MGADPNRASVYQAEESFYNDLSQPWMRQIPDLADVRIYAAQVTSSPVWLAAGGPAEVAAHSADRRRKGSAFANAAGVHLKARVRFAALIVHELAHVGAGLDHGHDRVFAGLYLDLIGDIEGVAAHDRLAAALHIARAELPDLHHSRAAAAALRLWHTGHFADRPRHVRLRSGEEVVAARTDVEGDLRTGGVVVLDGHRRVDVDAVDAVWLDGFTARSQPPA